MQIEIHQKPGAAYARVNLLPREEVIAEAGAMIAQSSDVAIETTAFKKNQGGILVAAKRLLAGESFFINRFTAGSHGGELLLGTPAPGDMEIINVGVIPLIVQGSSFVACEKSVKLDMTWQGFRSLLSGESIFWIRMEGAGQCVINSYGAIFSVDVDGDYIVDTGHIVAFESTLSFNISKAGSSWLHSFLGGECLICHFKGRGKLWIQSHNFPSLGRLIGSNLKPR